MPEFSPSSAHTAIAPVVVKPSGLSCEAEVFLGPDEATKVVTSGLVVFTSTGASQDIHLPVTMPAEEGTYHVFIDVYAEGILIAAYKAIEDVTIAPAIACTCPYCGATLSSLSELFDHIREVHFPIPEDYYYCGYCGAEFSTLDDLLSHFEAIHLDIITSPPPDISVYCPGQVRQGEDFEVTATFPLENLGDNRYRIAVEFKTHDPAPERLYGQFASSDLIAQCPVAYTRCAPITRDGIYTLEGVVRTRYEERGRERIAAKGTYAIWAVAAFRRERILFCYQDPDGTWHAGTEAYVEYTIWNFDTGKRITVV